MAQFGGKGAPGAPPWARGGHPADGNLHAAAAAAAAGAAPGLMGFGGPPGGPGGPGGPPPGVFQQPHLLNPAVSLAAPMVRDLCDRTS